MLAWATSVVSPEPPSLLCLCVCVGLREPRYGWHGQSPGVGTSRGGPREGMREEEPRRGGEGGPHEKRRVQASDRQNSVHLSNQCTLDRTPRRPCARPGAKRPAWGAAWPCGFQPMLESPRIVVGARLRRLNLLITRFFHTHTRPTPIPHPQAFSCLDGRQDTPPRVPKQVSGVGGRAHPRSVACKQHKQTNAVRRGGCNQHAGRRGKQQQQNRRGGRRHHAWGGQPTHGQTNTPHRMDGGRGVDGVGGGGGGGGRGVALPGKRWRKALGLPPPPTRQQTLTHHPPHHPQGGAMAGGRQSDAEFLPTGDKVRRIGRSHPPPAPSSTQPTHPPTHPTGLVPCRKEGRGQATRIIQYTEIIQCL